jgi:anti-anti-sigma factor
MVSAVELCREDERLIIRVRGEMDLDWERTHGSRVRSAIAYQPPFVVFDLHDAVFVDSTGLGVMAYAIRHASERVILVGAALRIRQLIHASGLQELLTLVDGWDDVTSSAQRPG